MISGPSQFGNAMLPSWEITANYVVVNGGSPNAANGHYVEIRRPSGRVDQFWWNGSAYAAPTGVFDALTTVGGNYLLTGREALER
jgi:hypothetical protein